MPANAYVALAKQRTGEEHQALLLMAAGRLIQDGSWQQARTILTQLQPDSSVLLYEKKILQAKISRIQNKPHDILTLLSQIHPVNQLPQYYQAQFHELLAQAYHSLNNPAESINERVKLDALLTDNTNRGNNRRALWLSLTQLPSEELNTIRVEATDDVATRAWMELALIAREYPNTPHKGLDALIRWSQTYPNHPGNSLLPPSLEDMRPLLHNPPRHIALLLPLTGNLAGPGLAIKEGFLSAFNQQSPAAHRELRVYDTNRAPADALYAQALQDGAEFVIGPLTKADVALVAPLPHPVPTLLLNDVQTPLHSNAYQFGLSPILEAQQIAAKARQNGLTRALIITPAGPWGEDVSQALIEQWQALGGRVTDHLALDTRTDIHQQIRTLLRIDASESRAVRMGQILGHHVESTPSRRHDFDVIFLISYPNAARQIKPLLNYYYAGDVPVYALSTVYSGTPNTTQDRDLNGIIFVDMPWIFTHAIDQKNWPESYNSYNRLYALGLDSFALTTQLNALLLFPAIRTENGVLYLSTNQHIARIPTFVQFHEGLPQFITPD
jgi:outer membrane PBP1 activator LpoA protein